MHFIDTKALSLELKNGHLSQSDKFKYFLGGTILTTVHYNLMFLYGTGGLSVKTLINGLINTVIVFVGSYILFNTNKSGDNKNFIERFVCLSFLISLKVLALRTVGYLMFLYTLGGIFNERVDWISEGTLNLIYYYIFGYATVFLYYYLMNNNIRIVSHDKRTI